jgi:S1-C subfamily serine protease
MSDRTLGRVERRFLDQLRRRCGVGFFRYQAVLARTIPTSRRVLIALFAIVVLGSAVAVRLYEPPGLDTDAATEVAAGPALSPPQEAPTHPQLMLPPAEEGLEELEPAQLYETVRRSVVRLIVRLDEQPIVGGSGAVIGIDRGRHHYFVVTNRHVIMHQLEAGQTLSFEVEFENQARFDGVLDFYSRRHDLALLAVLGTPLWARPVAMRPAADLVVGERVYAVGSPMGLRHTFTGGIISALRDGMIQTDATVHSGSSGGPLFDSRGLLCGIVTSTHNTKDLSFALYADAVISMLEERRASGG